VSASRRPLTRLSAALLVLGLLAACSHAPRLPLDWQDHAAAVRGRTGWDLQGKIGLRSSAQNGSALLSWRQREAEYRVVLSGALGLGKLVLNGGPGGVTWTGRDGGTRAHPDPAALIRELWGWEVPVASLAWWVRGLPDPAHRLAEPRFENGLATRFEQAGWVIEPQAYRTVEGIELPTRVRLQGEGAVLTVSVSRWSLAAP
jgi:outer membrane lipoprotein LolB